MSEMEGQWTASGGTLNGTIVPSNSLTSMSLQIQGGTFSASSGGLTSGGNIAVAQAGTNQLNFMINSGSIQENCEGHL
ncbi:MAG: hypothetical protein R3C03_19270 [Pirellulaceae bacterium]